MVLLSGLSTIPGLWGLWFIGALGSVVGVLACAFVPFSEARTKYKVVLMVLAIVSLSATCAVNLSNFDPLGDCEGCFVLPE